jgi:AcrR family transcriptional regulator
MKTTKIDKNTIAEKAADLYITNSSFTVQQLTEVLEITTTDFYRLFPNRRSVLQYFYEAQLLKTEEIILSIGDFHSYTLSEKLSTVAFTLTDLLGEKREFTKQTFNSLIVNRSSTPFSKKLNFITESLFHDKGISMASKFVLNQWTYRLIAQHYIWMIQYWLGDNSHNQEKTMALVDKWTAFVQEVMYSSIIDKGFDLAKFTLTQAGFFNTCTDKNDSKEEKKDE